MPVETVRAREEVEADRGRVALQRGPVVYCMEQQDNPELSFDGFEFSASGGIYVEHRPELLGGVTTLTVGSGRAE